MTANEFRKWVLFNEKEPLNSIEIQLAQLSTMVNLGLGGKGNFEDFLPGERTKEKEVPLTPQQLNDLVKGMF